MVKLLKLNLEPPKDGLELYYNNKFIRLERDDLADICMIIKTAYNRRVFRTRKKLPVDRLKLLKMNIYHLLEDRVRQCFEQTPETGELEKITLMFKRLNTFSSYKINDYKTLEKICRSLKPDITHDEVFDLVDNANEE